MFPPCLNRYLSRCLNCRIAGLIAATCCFSTPLFAWQMLSNDIDIHCAQKQGTSLDCHYRPLFPGSANKIRAHAGGMELAVVQDQGGSGNISVILFLVDTSDPARENVVKKNIQEIGKLVLAGKPAHRLGLASFDRKLRILAPIGSSKSRIMAAAKTLKAEGKTTELYRSLLLAIEKLSRINAANKAIYLFSDGQAEDRAYFRTDVIKAARRKGVVINSFGFARSVSLSVALQTMRRLSEESGGIYIEANSNFDLDDRFYHHPFRNIDAGKDFSVDLAPLADIASVAIAEVTLDFTTDIGDLKIKVPVSLPRAPAIEAPAAAPPELQPTPVPAAIKVVTPVSEPEKIDFWVWYGLPVALVLLFSIALITLILIYRKQPDKATIEKTFSPQQNKPFAYLVTQEENARRYPILSTTWRIGRGRDNELSLDDKSVSRLHAEIHRYNNGNFFIMDMQSLNGIYVNDEQVSNRKLQEGDIIEIGDIYLRFTHHAEDHYLDDDTAIQKTRMPAS